MIKKKINIVLIVAVAWLWGTVGFRFVRNYFNVEGASEYLVSDYNSGSDFRLVERDTFELKKLDRDPFLNHSVNRNREREVDLKAFGVKTANSKSRIKSNALKPKIQWPKIDYFGFMAHGKTGEVALLKINDVVYRIGVKENKQGVTVKNIYKDSVLVIFQRELRGIKRN